MEDIVPSYPVNKNDEYNMDQLRAVSKLFHSCIDKYRAYFPSLY